MRPAPSSRTMRLSLEPCSESGACSEPVRLDAASAPGRVAMPGTSLQCVAELRRTFGGNVDAREFPGKRCERVGAERDGQQRRAAGEDIEHELVQAMAHDTSHHVLLLGGTDSRSRPAATYDEVGGGHGDRGESVGIYGKHLSAKGLTAL